MTSKSFYYDIRAAVTVHLRVEICSLVLSRYMAAVYTKKKEEKKGRFLFVCLFVDVVSCFVFVVSAFINYYY